MSRRRKRDEAPKGAPMWMATFSDLMTLILVFFILLFSFSQVDIIKFRAVAESFDSVVLFDFYPSVIPFDNPSSKNSIMDLQNEKDEFPEPTDSKDNSQQASEAEQSSLDQLLKEINEYIEANDLTNVVSAVRKERGVVLTLQEKVLFKSGEAELLRSSYDLLNKIGILLQNVPYFVDVEGHTDNRPISTYKFPSNWELSSSRASSVVRFLINNNHLDGVRFRPIGYGETRPAVLNSPETWQQNRRVELVIKDPSYVENNMKKAAE